MDREKREQEILRARTKQSGWNKCVSWFLEEASFQKVATLAGLSLIIAFLLTPSFTVDSPSYQLGDVADRNIKAKQEFLIQDTEATAKKREEASRQVALVYDLDESVAQQVETKLKAAFQAMREPSEQKTQPSAGEATTSDRAPDLSRNKKDIEAILGFQVLDRVFVDLTKKRSRTDLQDKVLLLVKSAFAQGVVSSKAKPIAFRGESIVIRKLGSQEETILALPHSYLDLEEARKFVKMQAVEQGWDAKDLKTIVFLSTQLLQPNLSFNPEETQRRIEQAYGSVKPVYIQLMKNEMLVREGQKIGPEELLKLRTYERKGPNQNRFLVFFTLFLFASICICVVVNVARQHLPYCQMEARDFLFLGILVAFLLTLGRSATWFADMIGAGSPIMSGRTLVYAVPLTAGAMLASVFFGVTISLISSLLLTLFAGMLFGKDFGLYFYFLIGSFVAAHGVIPCRNRIVPIRAGLLVGCTNVILIVLSALLQDQWVPLGMLVNTFFGFFGGIFAGVLVIGLIPLVELAFGYTTDVKLLELATMDQPLLQELMVQAPGTYHHSIIVGNMVEASAKSIGANSLLAKVAAYYHDIGKIKKPLYFIENQFDCENRHEKLAPSMSSLILTSHVKDGVELARHHRLGKPIVDIISQSHGTSFISFFYKKAQESREKAQTTKGAELPPINMDDYRYPGPKPQTKEAGLVMLADVVEAACRSLTEPTPARIQGMVNRLINNIFTDGQLDECELTLKDLHHIAKHFNQILATVHHKRIEYPAVCILNGKGKPDAPDSSQRESKQDRDKAAANRESGRTDLKRLGIH